jgi:hypothetical protein
MITQNVMSQALILENRARQRAGNFFQLKKNKIKKPCSISSP